MSLSESQQQALATIETELHGEEPGLAAEFAAFSGGLQCPAGPWPLGPPQGRRGSRRGRGTAGRWLPWRRG